MESFFRGNEVSSVDVNDLEQILGRINLIDVREPFEYESGHLPTAVNIPMMELLKEPSVYLDKNNEYYIICKRGVKSSITCNELKLKGFKIVNVKGGTDGYEGTLER